MDAAKFKGGDAAAIAASFSSDPWFFLWTVLSNNPDYVSERMMAWGLISSPYASEDLLDYFSLTGWQMADSELKDCLNVPWNPDADNNTANLEPVLAYQQQVIFGDNSPKYPYAGFAELFPQAVDNLYDYMQKASDGTADSLSDKMTDASEKVQKDVAAIKNAAAKQKADAPKKRRMWLFIGTGVSLLILIGLTIWALSSGKKKGGK